MDCTQQAVELLRIMQELHKAKQQKNFNEALHGESFVLDYVVFRGGDVLPGEISSEMDVSSARIAAALNSLESKGMVTRRIDKNDRRKILVEATDAGKAFAEEHRHKMLEKMTQILDMLGEHDAKEYVRIMGRLAEIFPKCREPL